MAMTTRAIWERERFYCCHVRAAYSRAKSLPPAFVALFSDYRTSPCSICDGMTRPPRGGCAMAESSQKTPAKSEEKALERAPTEWSPLGNLRREFDRMLDEFPWGWRRPLARGLFDVEPFLRGFGAVGSIPAVD